MPRLHGQRGSADFGALMVTLAITLPPLALHGETMRGLLSDTGLIIAGIIGIATIWRQIIIPLQHIVENASRIPSLEEKVERLEEKVHRCFEGGTDNADD